VTASRLMLAVALAMAVTHRAGAASLDEYLRHGYRIYRITSVTGAFTGCSSRQTLTFADSSVFNCASTHSQIAYQPRVYILSRGVERPSVVIIGTSSYSGSISRLGDKTLPRALSITADPLDREGATKPTSNPDAALKPAEGLGRLAP
jgi:hypothetical protein